MRFESRTIQYFKYLTITLGFVLGFHHDSGWATDFQSPRTSSLGGAGHANPILSDAIYLNPSFISYMQTHSISVNYLTFGNGTIQGPSGQIDYYGHNLNVSVMDGTPESLFQAGFGYTRKEEASLIHISASKNLFSRMGIGLGTKFIFPHDTPGRRIIDGTLSVTGILASWLQASLIVDNLLESAQDLNLFRELILGTRANVMGIFSIYFDPHWTPSLPGDQGTWGYEAGAEFPFFTDFSLRAGTFQNSYIAYQGRRGRGVAAGVGWMAPKISFDYAYQRVLEGQISDSHQFGVTIFF